MDRAHTDHDHLYHGLDPDRADIPLSAQRSPRTSDSNTSDRRSSTDLSHILLNIKSCRWRHFRPRTLPLHQLDNAHPLFRRLSRDLRRPCPIPTEPGRPCGERRTGRGGPTPAPVAGRSHCGQTEESPEKVSVGLILKAAEVSQTTVGVKISGANQTKDSSVIKVGLFFDKIQTFCEVESHVAGLIVIAITSIHVSCAAQVY